jgi:hypothetical protein
VVVLSSVLNGQNAYGRKENRPKIAAGPGLLLHTRRQTTPTRQNQPLKPRDLGRIRFRRAKRYCCRKKEEQRPYAANFGRSGADFGRDVF